MSEEAVEYGCNSLLMPVCGLSWEHFVENQCGGRRGRGERPDLVGRRGE